MKTHLLLLILIGLMTTAAGQMVSYRGIKAEQFHVKKHTAKKFVASYRSASGEIMKEMKTGERGGLLKISYDVKVDQGLVRLYVISKSNESILWEENVDVRSTDSNFLIDLPQPGIYLLAVSLKDATGKHTLSWSLNPSRLKKAHQ